MLITADTVVTGSELLRPGWVDIADGRIEAVGSGVRRLGRQTTRSVR